MYYKKVFLITIMPVEGIFGMSVEGFFGANKQNLMDMIQMWGLAKTTGILNIASGKETGEIHFKDGRVVWAKAGQYLSNEDAIYHLLALEEGKFRFVNTSEINKNASLNASYHEVILEGMRRVDHFKNESRGLNEKFGFIPYIVKSAGSDTLSYEEKVFLGLVDGRRNLEKVFNNCGLGVHKSFEVYNNLLSGDIIKLRQVRVLVVDDQGVWRRIISGMVVKDPYFEVVGTAEDGVDALKKLSELRPDVMTLDLEMPRLDGIRTLYWMMSGGYDILLNSYQMDIEDTYRCPVVVISAIAKRMAPETLEALMGGASGYITKPSQVVPESLEEQQQHIAKTVLMSSQVDLVKARRIKAFHVKKKESVGKEASRKLVCVASSMVGGLTSLIQMIPRIPGEIDASVFVVIDDLSSIEHARSFAEFLDRHSQVNVLAADKNYILRKGSVYIASGSQAVQFGMTQTGQTAFKVTQRNDKEDSRHQRPIDAMLLSSIRCRGFDKRVGVVLAGDGADGNIGFHEMVRHGEKVFAQDSYSSLNPVKPEIVSNTGIARITPLGEMVKFIMDEVGKVS